MLRAILKFIVFAIVIALYLVASLIIYTLCFFKIQRARIYLTHIVSLVSKAALKIIGINIQVKKSPDQDLNHALIVSNHLSYMDIFIISSHYPTCFVTSIEMKKTFFLGHLCMLGGCLFVDRKNRRNIHMEVQALTEVLSEKLNVAIFPEAMSTDGSEVRNFKSPLLQAAIDSDSFILPLCLNYQTLDDNKVSVSNRDELFWYGEKSFFAHILNLFQRKKIQVEMKVLNYLEANKFESKAELALHLQKTIESHYIKIV